MREKPTLVAQSALTPLDNRTRKVAILPGVQSTDFIVTSRCAIVSVGGRLDLSAIDIPGDSRGLYSWSTTSNKIRLRTTEGPTTVVEALHLPGSGRDSEEILVTRRGSDGSTKEKKILLTVAQITFKQAATQRYGYDDFDSPAVQSDHHISIASGESSSVSVEILGGAVGSDFQFLCDDPRACDTSSPPENANFDLQLHAKQFQKKKTILRAKVKCPGAAEFARTNLHIYSERVVNVVVAKVEDTTSMPTRLAFRDGDYASHQDTANRHLRAAVVKFNISNYHWTNSTTNIPFDPDGAGALIFNIAEGGGPGLEAIDQALRSEDQSVIRVAVIKKMRSLYFLERAAHAGTDTIYVQGSSVLSARMDLGSGTTKERIRIISATGNRGKLESPLQFSHPTGASLEFMAGGWDTNPILVVESDTVLKTQWIIAHEVAHRALKLKDLNDATNLMHYTHGSGEYKLRYLPRPLKYVANTTENQWEKIQRDPPPRSTP